MNNETQNQNLNIATPPVPEPKKVSILKNKWLSIGIVIVVLLIVAGSAYFLGKNTPSNQLTQIPTPTPVRSQTEKPCTQEAKMCPDGSSVGRTEPNCEFAKCPIATSIPDQNKQTSLAIPEFGIKLALTKDIEDAYYDGSTTTKGYVYLRVHSLDTEPQCLNDKSSTAALSKVGKDEVNEMSGQKYSDFSNGVTIGNYYYYIDLAQYACAETPAGKAKLESVRKAFSNASSTIQKL